MLRLLCAGLLLATGAASAEPPAADVLEVVTARPCRPTIACTAELVPAGALELETGYGATESGGWAHSGQLLLKYTFVERLQLQVGTNALFLAGPGLVPRAFDGVTPGLKWWVNGQGRLLPSNSLSLHVTLPTQAFAEARQKSFDLQAVWYVSKDVAFLHADANLVLNVFDLAGARTPQGLASLVLSFALPARFGVFTEGYSAFGNAQAVPLDGGWRSGVSFSPLDELVFDLGGDVGFYPGTRAVSLFAGVTFVPHGRIRGRR